jgi:hypothetical protein
MSLDEFDPSSERTLAVAITHASQMTERQWRTGEYNARTCPSEGDIPGKLGVIPRISRNAKGILNKLYFLMF